MKDSISFLVVQPQQHAKKQIEANLYPGIINLNFKKSRQCREDAENKNTLVPGTIVLASTSRTQEKLDLSYAFGEKSRK